MVGRDGHLRRLSQLSSGRAAIWGGPGTGKSALANCFADASQRSFPDGIHWCSFGPGADTTAAKAELGRLLGELGVPASAIATANGLGGLVHLINAAVAGRRVLLVLDDVCDARLARRLRLGGPEAVVLMTTRSLAAAKAFPHSALVEVGNLSEEASSDFFTGALPELESAEVRNRLIGAAGGHPQASAILCAQIGMLIGEGRPVEDAVREIAGMAEAALRAASAGRPAARPLKMDSALRAAISVAWTNLSAQGRRALAQACGLPPSPSSFDPLELPEVSRDRCYEELEEAGLAEERDLVRLAIPRAVWDFARGDDPLR